MAEYPDGKYYHDVLTREATAAVKRAADLWFLDRERYAAHIAEARAYGKALKSLLDYIESEHNNEKEKEKENENG